jgi:redox-sensitive bicupin YhaK (pirin superfamily)
MPIVRSLVQAIVARDTPLVGDARVLRALPRRERRRVGPFVFLDHFGPEPPTMNVPPHPHVGLATVSYLFSGTVVHRDSIGNAQALHAGGVHWMTAGSGIVHEEIADANGGALHGLQLWVALPIADRSTAPRFQHVDADALPIVARDGASMRVVAGSIGDARSSVDTFASTTLIDLDFKAGARVDLDVRARDELGVYVVSGALDVAGSPLEAHTLGVLSDGDRVTITATSPTRAILFGGAPNHDVTVLWWNFVTDSIEHGKALEDRWKSGGFPALEATK